MSEPVFNYGMKKLGENYDQLTDEEKINLFKQTSIQEADIRDLALISPFYGHMFYEE